MRTRAATIAPRLLTRNQAATYCGLSLGAFSMRCPVRAVSVGDDARLERFDVRALDRWIDSIGAGAATITQEDYLARLG